MASRKYVVDMDDLCDAVMTQEHGGRFKHLVDELAKWHDHVPSLKITLFTIPRRTSSETVKAVKSLGEWVSLAPHGWEHTRGECLSWTKEEAVEKIKMAREMGIDAPIFRAPAWLLDESVYDACGELDYAVASHSTFRIPGTGVREYVYNHHMGREKGVIGVHGHLTPVCGNHIYDMLNDGRLSFPSKCNFIHAHEAAIVVSPNVKPVYVEGEPEEEIA